MKKFIIFIFLFSIFSLYLYCQEADSINNGGDESFPKLLILDNNNFLTISYQFPDGTGVSSAELMKLLNIPSNQTLLKECKQLSITSRIINILTLASAGGMFVYIFADLPYSNIMLPTFSGICIASVAANLFTVQITNIKFLHAVDNYNLHILGIPVIRKKNNG